MLAYNALKVHNDEKAMTVNISRTYRAGTRLLALILATLMILSLAPEGAASTAERSQASETTSALDVVSEDAADTEEPAEQLTFTEQLTAPGAAAAETPEADFASAPDAVTQLNETFVLEAKQLTATPGKAVIRYGGFGTGEEYVPFIPGDDTTDDEATLEHRTDYTAWVMDITEGTVIPTPLWFGHRLAKWTTADARELDAGYICTADDAAAGLDLTAQWAEATYPITLSLGQRIESQGLVVWAGVGESGGTTSMADFAEQYAEQGVTWNGANLTMPAYTYNETLGDYFDRVFGGELHLYDRRSEADNRLQFAGWSVTGNPSVTMESRFARGDLLAATETGGKVAQWLQENTLLLGTTQWAAQTLTLTLVNMPAAWSVLINGSAATVTNGRVDVPNRALVTLRTTGKDTITHWGIVDVDGNRPTPAETRGSGYRDYTFEMPYANVTMTYTASFNNYYVNLYDSPIVFVDNYVIDSGRSVSGFWYKKLIDGMTPVFFSANVPSALSGRQSHITEVFGTYASGDADRTGENAAGAYFYEWNPSDAFYVTSEDQETGNQMVITSEHSIYLNRCDLRPRASYLKDWVGAGTGASASHYSYGNIVLDKKADGVYTFYLYIVGENAVGAISDTADVYGGTVYLRASGSGACLTLGTICGNFLSYISGQSDNYITLRRHPDARSEHIVYNWRKSGSYYYRATTVSYAQLETAGKRYRHTNLEYCVGDTGTLDGIWMADDHVRIRYCDLYVHGSLTGNYSDYNIYYSKVVVDGYITRTSYQYHIDSARAKCENSVVVIKGAGASGRFSLKNCIFVTDTLMVDYQLEVNTGALLIANKITNYNWSLNNANTFANFSGGKICLLGYGENSASIGNSYSAYGDSSNPLRLFYSYLLDSSTGHIRDDLFTVSSLSATAGAADPTAAINLDSMLMADGATTFSEALAALETTAYTSSALLRADFTKYFGSPAAIQDCLEFGSPSHTVVNTITGGTFYCAGNLSFRQTTNVTGGTVICGGAFGCRSDYTISGSARITAASVGNLRHTETTENGIRRWPRTTVSGSGVTIRTETLGAALQDGVSASDAAFNRSVVVISGAPGISGISGSGSPLVIQDIMVNQIYDSSLFTVAANDRVSSLRLSGSLSGGVLSEMSLVADNGKKPSLAQGAGGTVTVVDPIPGLTAVDDNGDGVIDWFRITLPTINADNTSGKWLYDSLSNADAVTGVRADGALMGLSDTLYFYSDFRTSLNLYAASSQYTLYLMAGPTTAVPGVTFSDGSRSLNQVTYAGVKKASAEVGQSVTLSVPSDMLGKVVVWYADSGGNVHNVLGGKDASGSSITFTMPAADTEIWITEDLTLYLDLYGIGFTRDGFRVEYQRSRNDSEFYYKGNLRVRQSNLKSTAFDGNYGISSTGGSANVTNKMIFEAGSGNGDGSRTITLSTMRLVLPYSETLTATAQSYGATIEAGESVALLVDGAIWLDGIYMNSGASLSISGANHKNDANCHGYDNSLKNYDYIRFNQKIFGYPSFDWVTISDIHVIYDTNVYNSTAPLGILVCDQKGASRCELTNVTLHAYTGNWPFFRMVHTATLNNCYLSNTGGYATGFAFIVDSVTLSDTGASWWEAGSSSSTLNGVSSCASLTLEGNCRVDYKKQSGYTMSWSYGANTITVKDTSELVVAGGMFVNALNISDSASVQVSGEGASEGALFVNSSVTVKNSGRLSANYILLSGYVLNSSVTQDYLLQQLNKDSTFTSGTGKSLTMDGGTVTAGSFVGGSMGGTITVNGGVLTAPAIGAIDKRFGSGTRMGVNNVWFWTGTILPSNSAAVNIAGGTVNVTENGYLGGMKGKVTVTGGTVNLGSGAVMGVTDAQVTSMRAGDTTSTTATVDITSGRVTAEGVTVGADGAAAVDSGVTPGAIRVKYGTVRIAGENTSVLAGDINADYGELRIAGATAAAYKNPKSGQPNVSVYVVNDMQAYKIYITDGSRVYAGKAHAYAATGYTGDKSGYFEVAYTTEQGVNTARAWLYAGSYGPSGPGNVRTRYIDDPNDTTGRNVIGTKYATVTYVLDPAGLIAGDGLKSEKDIDNTDNEQNFSNFDVTPDAQWHSLAQPTLTGYKFLGWYTAYQGGYSESLLTTGVYMNDPRDWTFYARWERATVKVEIHVDLDGFDEAKLAVDRDELLEHVSGTEWRFKQTFERQYGEEILTGVNLSSGKYRMEYFEIINENKPGDITYTGKNGSTTIYRANPITVLCDTDRAGESYVWPDDGATMVLKVKLFDSPSRKYVTFDLGGIANARVLTGPGISSQAAGNPQYYLEKTATLGETTHREGTSSPVRLSVNGELAAAAPGYTFDAWYTGPNGTGNAVIVSGEGAQTVNELPSTLYAKWTVNTYKVVFDAGEDGRTTPDNSEPDESSAQSLIYTWQYDASYDTDGAFKLDGTTPAATLPYAWREGYKFDGWVVTADGDGPYVNNNTTPKLTLTDAITGFEDTHGDASATALTLYAHYTHTKVTYLLNGGTWYAGEAAATEAYTELAYNAPLPGYTETVQGEVEIIEQYDPAAASAGATGTYRDVLYRRGYTFEGWQENGKDYKRAPQYKDLTLTAQWSANRYDLKIWNKDKTAWTTVAGVTVDEELNAAEGWPSASAAAWTDFIGATFADLSGTGSEGEAFNTALNRLQFDWEDTNAAIGSPERAVTSTRALFRNAVGMKFYLPTYAAYTKDLGEAAPQTFTARDLPDYPNGCTIELYGVFGRQRIVFVEQYTDVNGLHESVFHSQSLSDAYYPAWSEYIPPEKLTRDYSFLGWHVNVNAYDPSGAALYPKTEAGFTSEKVAEYQRGAATNGTYDVMVYTVYRVEQTQPGSVLTQQDPTKDNVTSQSFTILGAFLEDEVSYEYETVSGSLQLATKADLYNNRFKNSWTTGGTTYDANRTIAVTFSIDGRDEIDVLTGGTPGTVKPGSTVAVNVYHSMAISSAPSPAPKFKLTLKSETEAYSGQFTAFEIVTNFQRTKYSVTYAMKLPEAQNSLEDLLLHGFAGAGRTVTKELPVYYGDTLLALDGTHVPAMEGYELSGTHWRLDSETGAELTSDTLTTGANAEGRITLALDYAPLTYELTVDMATTAKWTVEYGGVMYSTAGSAVKVPYHTAVSFAPQGTQYAELILLTMGSRTRRLLEYESESAGNTTYTFRMPAASVTAQYSDVTELYLAEGSIRLTPELYSQNGGDTPWHGHYRILQKAGNAPGTNEYTQNTLTLEGDLSARTIELGNLQIGADDSIALSGETVTKAQLAVSYDGAPSTLRLQNISVPSSAALTMSGGTLVQRYTSPRYAFIGGADRAASGAITLTGLTLICDMESPAGTEDASMIGPGSPSAAGGAITLTNCVMTVDREVYLNRNYTGTWIGGAHVTSVSLDHVTLDVTNQNAANTGATAIDAATVTIRGCALGQTGTILDPIHAGNTLTVENSAIRMLNMNALAGRSMLGTDNGTTTITNGTDKAVLINYDTEKGSADKLYTGKLVLTSATAGVSIDGERIVDVSNGAITVTAGGVTQLDTTHTHMGVAGNVRVIDEKPGHISNDLNVSGLRSGGVVTVGMAAAVSLTKISGQADTTLALAQDMTVSGTVSAEGDLVIRGNGHAIKSSASAARDVTAGGDMTLTDVTIEYPGNVTAKGDVTVTGGTIGDKAAAARVGSTGDAANETVTKVTFADTTIRAEALGALGTTFTTVTRQGQNTLTGTLYRDVYRLSFVDPREEAAEYPTVLRLQSVNGGAETAYTALPTADALLCWYYVNTADKLVAVGTSAPAGSVWASVPETLSEGTIDRTTKDAQANSDGTRTLTLHAWYTTDRIIFDANDGAGATKSQDIAKGAEAYLTGLYELGLDTTGSGSFAGWSLSAGGEVAYYNGQRIRPEDHISAPTQELTLYAQWTTDTHRHDGASFKAWTAVTSLPSSGSYYLTGNVRLSAAWTVEHSVVLCLNGYEICQTEDGQGVISVAEGGTLELYDCDENSTHNTHAYAANKSVTGGLITGGSAAVGGGVTVRGTLNMHGGAIAGNAAARNGGGVYVDGGTFRLLGGSVLDNSAQNGGGVYVNAGVFEATGGEIVENRASTGGGVYAGGGFELSGSPVIAGNTAGNDDSNVYLPTGRTIAITGRLSGETKLGVTMQTPGAFTTGYSTEHGTAAQTPKKHFASENTGFAVEWLGGEEACLTAETDGLKLKVDGTNDTLISAGMPARLLIPGGEYYLSANVDVTQVEAATRSWLAVPGGVTATLYLNGNTADGKKQGRLIYVSGGGALTVEDQYGSGGRTGGVLKNGSAENGGGAYVDANGTLNLNSGKLLENTATQNGGGVYVGGTFRMSGGTISLCGARSGGGAYVDGTFRMSGGAVSGNTAGAAGGGVYLSQGVFELTGGAVSQNKATSSGGGVAVAGGEFSISGADVTVSGNEAVNGGGVYSNAASAISAGAVAENAGVNGAGFYLAGGALDLAGGQIQENAAAQNGGGVYYADGALSISGAVEVSRNAAGEKDENLFVCEGKTIAVETLTYTVPIGVTMQTAGEGESAAFTTGFPSDKDPSDYFISEQEDASFQVTWTANADGTQGGEARLAKLYTVNFDAGAYGTPQSTAAQVYYGRRVSAPAPPIRTGHTFIAWNNSQTEKPYVFEAPVTQNGLTLIAQWRANSTFALAAAEGRRFTTGGVTGTAVQTDTNGAWTSRITALDIRYYPQRDYEIVFTSSLPAGTDLTLAVVTNPGLNESCAYYFYTAAEPTSRVRLRAFTSMGGAGALALSGEAVRDDFLLSVDFHDAGQAAAGGTARFRLLSGDEEASDLEIGEVTYAVNAVSQGSLRASADGGEGSVSGSIRVTAAPAGDSTKTGKKLYLVAELTGAERAPYTAAATYNNAPGTWLSGTQVAFDLGKDYGTLSAGGETPYKIEGLAAGSYGVRWTLCAAAGTPNVLADAVSAAAELAGITVSAASEPTMRASVTAAKLTYTAEDSTKRTRDVSAYLRQLRCGDALTFEIGSGEAVSVTAEKQTGGAYSPVSAGDGVTVTGGTVTFGETAAAGRYRLRVAGEGTDTTGERFFRFVIW